MAVNVSAEMALLACQELHQNVLNISGVHCSAVWDTILCWPPAMPGQIVPQKCPVFKGIDPTKFAYKKCGVEGRWEGRTPEDNSSTIGWTNYTTCYTPEMRKIMLKLYSGAEGDPDIVERRLAIAKNTRILELVGLSLSLASLAISLFIFFHFRILKNNRTKIHRSLFVAMVIQVMVRLVLYVDQVVSRGGGMDNTTLEETPNGIDNTPFICEGFYVVLEYARTAMFMWMFVEGLYLNTMVSVTVFSPKFYKFYYFVGWGVPFLMTTIWATATGFVHGQISCWWNYNLTSLYWILEGPRIAVILLNMAFLANIIVVLVTKMRESSSSEAKQARKAVKAAVVLLPLLGINNIMNMVNAPLDRSVVEFAIWSYLTHFLASFQGFFVSLLYCFINGEVQFVLSKRIYDFFSARTTESYRRGSAFSGIFLTTVVEPSRVEQSANRRQSIAHSGIRMQKTPPAFQRTQV